ncbi:MAG: 50S ribosomal protein L4 [Planctomycetes bacterium]|nr:50S ribosomal protein L4 [Planctomycetota bacterium]
MVEVTCFNGKSGGVAKIDVDAAPFGEKVRKRLMRHAFLHYAAAHRAGTHSTLTRAEVNFNTRKPWKQKGTGRARSGDFSSPLWRKGGIALGPKPRSYVTNLPRRMRLEALRSSLLGKLNDGELKLLDGVTFDVPKTKKAADILKSLGITYERTLVVVAERGEGFVRSFRNLPNVDIRMAVDLNAEHVLLAKHVILDRRALDQILERLSDA